MIPIQAKLVPASAGNHPHRDMPAVGYITIHNTGNYAAGATARMHADYQFTGSGGREASWHYTVDADEIWQSFPDASMCWHAGDGSGTGNASSIAIEICVNDASRFPQACENAAQLTATLLHKHGLAPEAVKQHYDWSGKDCPAELRSGRWGVTWAQFLQSVRAHLAPPTVAPPIIAPAESAPSPWAAAAWQWAKDTGVTDGARPQDAATREEVVTLLYRALQDK